MAKHILNRRNIMGEFINAFVYVILGYFAIFALSIFIFIFSN